MARKKNAAEAADAAPPDFASSVGQQTMTEGPPPVNPSGRAARGAETADGAGYELGAHVLCRHDGKRKGAIVRYFAEDGGVVLELKDERGTAVAVGRADILKVEGHG